MLRLLTATILILSATPWFYQFAFAQIVPAPSTGPSNPVTQFNSNGFGYQYDLSGRSTNLYEYGNGMTGYTSKDSMGRITSQGTIYNPIRSTPLEAPPYNPPPLSGPPYGTMEPTRYSDGTLIR